MALKYESEKFLKDFEAKVSVLVEKATKTLSIIKARPFSLTEYEASYDDLEDAWMEFDEIIPDSDDDENEHEDEG